jgi:hypothetical protein
MLVSPCRIVFPSLLGSMGYVVTAIKTALEPAKRVPKLLMKRGLAGFDLQLCKDVCYSAQHNLHESASH